MSQFVQWCNQCNMSTEFDREDGMCETCGTFASEVRIVNLTPHAIDIYSDGEKIRKYDAYRQTARVETIQQIQPADIDGVPVRRSTFGKVTLVDKYTNEVGDFPDPVVNTFYIVSLMVAQALPNRPDLICPDTSPAGAVRNENGQIIGARGFQMVAESKLQVLVDKYNDMVSSLETKKEKHVAWEQHDITDAEISTIQMFIQDLKTL